MLVHLHRARQGMAWALGALALSPLALCFASPTTEPVGLAAVTGRLTIAGQPAGEVFLCLDEGNIHTAYSWLRHDGTFRLSNMRWFEGGAAPGRYHAHLYTFEGGPAIPERYRDPKTSGIVMDVSSDWNDFQIDLR